MYIQFCHIFNVKVIKFDEVDKDTAEDVEENETNMMTREIRELGNLR